MSALTSCPVCGFRFGPGVTFQGILGLGWAYKGRRVRWPRRKRSYTFCPECGHQVTIATDLTREILEVSFL